MKPLNNLSNLSPRPEIIRTKRRYGALYGLMAGLGFAAAAWGTDAYMLQNSHGYYPWLKLIIGIVACGLLGLVLGGVTAYKEKSLFGVILWVSFSLLFAWLVNAIPIQIAPALAARLDPQLGSLLHYSKGSDFMYRSLLAFLWVVPFLFITGIAQLPIVESGAFSTTPFGKIAPLLFCVVIMGIGGGFTDDLVNVHFRDAIIAMDSTIQFAMDNQGKEIDPATSRSMYLGSLRTINKYLDNDRHLFVGSYDDVLGTINVLVKFKEEWFDCTVVYNQPSNCKAITPP